MQRARNELRGCWISELTAWVIWLFTGSLRIPSKTNESPNFSAWKQRDTNVTSKKQHRDNEKSLAEKSGLIFFKYYSTPQSRIPWHGRSSETAGQWLRGCPCGTSPRAPISGGPHHPEGFLGCLFPSGTLLQKSAPSVRSKYYSCL